jgi:uncharacterized heparinase superfamily protein
VTHPQTRTTTCQVGDQALQAWSAEHDGYRRLSTPVTHRRSVTLDSARRVLTVVDVVDTAGEIPLRLFWHLGPEVTADLHGTEATLSWHRAGQSRRALLTLPESLNWSAHTGETDPVVGWYAPRLGARVPTTSLVGEGLGSSSCRLVTVLKLP